MSGQLEQAPAQDERNPTPADYLAARSALESCDWSNVPLGTKAILGRVVDLLWLAAQARPAQTEQQPELVMPVALGSVNADYDKGWADHAAEVRRLNAELLPSTPC